MGIKDLLKFMKPYIEPVHIKIYAGKRVAIDAYSWLHKGAYSCSMELCLNSDGEKKLRYIDYFMHRINLLRHYNITPVVVFDGCNLPCKAATEEERHRKRNTNLELAMAKLKEGNLSAATVLFQRAVSITPFIAHQLIQVLRLENIEFVVAPYEADAQLAYLSSLEAEKGGIVAVITEDSDLMAYGCPAIVFKMDRHGNGERIELEKVFNAETCKPSFRRFDMELFTGMCVLAGCDFLPSVPGIGIARAHGLVSKYRSLERALSALKYEKGDQVPEDYSKSFKETVAVFHHAQIYDVNAKALKHMKPIPPELLQSLDRKLDFLGPEIPPSLVTAIAEGNINPSTKEAFDKLQGSALPSDPTAFQSTGQLQKAQVPPPLTQESCFLVFSSNNTRESNTVKKQNKVFDEEHYSNEALALQKLITPMETRGRIPNTRIPDDTPLKVPDNNPFRIRKPMISLVQRDIYTEKDHVLSHVENLDMCLSPENFKEVESESFSRKRKFQNICSDQLEATDVQVSGITEVEDIDISSMAMESQESVNSKTTKGAVLNGRSKSEKKSKRSNFEKTKSKISSILNFFSRV
ncbi:hypothetical protein L6164_005391 [Bauhinia variegata]|uniref:Uncharacterized protein n=1 Tax=Bauhinia variegata TaxID=167791 RepID=A0ACB9PQG4_BAUVA|nr:hypothetical protein L6164_005391 [Bauhinia variegata]